ncbi:uncharacterized protein LOC115448799 [Manduca sexta]|uniref:uncharacterized protein LOC115448799 n=1 Tax=Manduca sexta TaxID=7130 RepID=UPI0011826679|nr:uncharacterized protein LOC115448799 [Manduca sexta]
MLFLMIVLLTTEIRCATSKNVGSTLFYNRNLRTQCWNEDDVARLRARKTFETLIPYPVNPDKVNSRYIKNTLRYFRTTLSFVEKDIDKHTAMLLKDALADVLGAHMRSEMLPTVRFAYYAGYIPYRYARCLENFYEEIKTYLNTQGLGWKRPERIPQWSNLTVSKIVIGSGRLFDPCSCLIIKRDSNSCIHLPVPKLDDESTPSAIALPFKSSGLVSLSSPHSENVLLKYYTTASRCILRSSPEKCRHADFVNFNNEMWHWMKRDIAPHLVDEKLYAAYGGVLRIAAAVQNYGKGLSRRNLFEYQNAGVAKWHPWKTLTQSYVYINTDWTPGVYIGFVLLSALAICLLQICYSYIFGDNNACKCKGRSQSPLSKDVAYTNVESNIPAMLPQQSAIYYSDRKRAKQSLPKTKSSSVGSVHTQKVYDLNENAEKLMAVIMSDKESEVESVLSSKSDEDCADECVNDSQTIVPKDPPKSPPKLETSISQVKIEKSKLQKGRKLAYSTSTRSHSELTYCQGQQSESWSETDSSTSSRSLSSTTSKSQTRQTKSSRNLAWAKRVISRQSIRGRSTSTTEIDVTSFTTPPSKR